MAKKLLSKASGADFGKLDLDCGARVRSNYRVKAPQFMLEAGQEGLGLRHP